MDKEKVRSIINEIFEACHCCATVFHKNREALDEYGFCPRCRAQVEKNIAEDPLSLTTGKSVTIKELRRFIAEQQVNLYKEP